MTPSADTLDQYYDFPPFGFQVYNLTNLTIESPADGTRAFSGGNLTIQANNTEATPLVYAANLNSSFGGGFSADYTFPFNSSSQFPVAASTRGASPVYFNVTLDENTVNFGQRIVEVFAAIEIASNSTEIEAGNLFYYSATSNYTDTFNASVQIVCDFGSITFNASVNSGAVQSIQIPLNATGA